MSLSKVVAYVTGAGQGLGRATALRLSSLGAKVVIVDLSAERAKAVADEIGPAQSMFAAIDITDEEKVKNSIKAATERWGPLNCNINCAGIAIATKTLSKKGVHDLSQFAKVLNVNTVGTFNVLRLAAESMSHGSADALNKGCRGVIINTASIAAMDGQIGQVTAYTFYDVRMHDLAFSKFSMKAAYAASKGSDRRCAAYSCNLPLLLRAAV